LLTVEGEHQVVVPFVGKSDLVVAAIRELIIKGELGPGARLRQRDLALRFGVSPTPVREALRQLEAEGLVRSSLHHGAVVAETDHEAIEDNYRIRAALESLAASMAAERITSSALVELGRLNRDLERPKLEESAIGELNRRLHFTIYEHAGSPVLISLMRLLWQSFPRGPQVVRPHEESIRQHRELIEALRAGDGNRAGELTRRHILGALERMRGERRGEQST
jgi:DNA-binding GntR family transcriptional regulator